MKIIKKWEFYSATLACLAAIVVCVICDSCLTGHLLWSMVTALSVIFGWLVLFPAFKAKNKVVKKYLIAISIIIIPYLSGLSIILRSSIIGTMGNLIAILSIVAVWEYMQFL